MAYATQQDIVDLYGEEYLLLSADRDGDGTADTGVASAALTAASSEIDSYLSSKYDLPLADTPSHLTKICVDVAIYHMCPSAPALTEEKSTRYKAAVQWLRDVAKGVIQLGLPDPPASIGGGPALTYANTTRRLFSRSSMRGL